MTSPAGTWARPLFTVGHSTRSLEELTGMLSEAGVGLLVDVRRFPSSRRHPHFSRTVLEAALAAQGIGYRHVEELGGRRIPRPDSANTAWRDEGFRGYADHMASPAFQAALGRLLEPGPPTAVMCAEALPGRCHRQLIADALVARGAAVRHLLAPGRVEPHVLHAAARLREDGTLFYPRGRQAPLPGV